ncbi:MAG: TIGR04211 family SH3 domain-containing protein [Proteobacteria bacterium]|nr:TIGR04211 family SH3 domain-containing protein [Pseudomonadota bacterium]
MLRFIITLSTLLLLAATPAIAQDTRYVSDKQYIPLRSGPGSDYRITHRGIPSGTRLSVARTSGDGTFAEITTAKGTTGWIRTQYLMKDLPAQNKLDAAVKKAADLEATNVSLASEAKALKIERVDVLKQIQSTDGQLDEVSLELTELKQISGNAVQLDTDNRRLIVESETLKSELDMHRAENQRLKDRLNSEGFMNGALAVLLGVIIALVVPRLWPKRRRDSGWA